MVDTRREQIYNNLITKESEELIEIWQNHNTDEWEDVVFELVREILLERLGYLPEISAKTKVKDVLARADKHLDDEEFEKALTECELAIQLNPESAIPYLYRGDTYKEMGKLELALADYRKAAELDPECKDAWKYLKHVENELGKRFEVSDVKKHLDNALEFAYADDPDAALTECETAKPFLPDLAPAYNYLGLIFLTLNQTEMAIDLYTRALELNPRFSAARENLKYARNRWEEEQYFILSDSSQNIIPEFDETGTELNEITDEDIVCEDDLAPGWVYLDANACLLSGWAGHRTRPGRSGYDPLESRFELAHMGGYMMHLILTCKFRTQNPFYLGFMALAGIFFSLPCLFLFIPWDWLGLSLIIISIPSVIIGIMLMVNVYLSLSRIIMGKNEDSDCVFF